MNGNPFYVAPLGGDISGITRGITGLGQALGQKRQRAEAAEAQTAMQQELQAAVQSRDPAQMAAVSLKYPHMAEAFDRAVGYATPDTQGVMHDAYAFGLSTNDPVAIADRLEQAAQQISDMGGNPTNILNDAASLRADPSSVANIHKAALFRMPELLSSWKAQRPEYQQGTGDLSGRMVNLTEGTVGPNLIGGVDGDGVPVAPPIPQAMIDTLSKPSQAAASATYAAAGGGKDGVKAVQAAMPALKEQDRRATVGNMMDTLYPGVTPEQRDELDAVVATSKTVPEGMKQAEKTRENQIKKEKAEGVKGRSIELLARVVTNPDLSDVTGAFDASKAAGWTRMDAGEHDAIADLEELTNLLTVDNLKLMTGVLSESDIKILSSIGGGALNRSRSDKQFLKDAKSLLMKLGGEGYTIPETGKPQTSASRRATRRKPNRKVMSDY